MTDCRLEQFDPAHGGEVLSWVQSAEDLYYWAARDEYPLEDVSVFEQWHADSGVSPYLLLQDEQRRGYGELWYDQDERSLELARLLVAPRQRRRGFGLQFVNLLTRRAGDYGVERVWIRLFPENQAAAACYSKAGFQRIASEEETSLNAEQRFRFHWMTKTL